MQPPLYWQMYPFLSDFCSLAETVHLPLFWGLFSSALKHHFLKITLYEKILISPVKLYIFTWAIRVYIIKGWMIEATLPWRSIFPIPIVSPPVPVKSNPWVRLTCRQVWGEADQEVVGVPVVDRGQVSIGPLTLLSCLNNELFFIISPVAVAGVRTIGPAKSAF